MKELITIVVNVYNGEKYIKKCLEQILNQTYKNIEILIINDGSTDNTLKIINRFKDKRKRVITTNNLGLSQSRNIGLDNAKGEYIYFIDVDDLISNNIIEYLYNLCKKNKASIATCKCKDINKYEINIKDEEENILILTKEEMLKKVLISKNREVAFWNKLIHKSIIKDLRFEDRIINDIALTYKLILNSNKIVYSNKTMYFHYNNDDSISIKKELDYNRNCDRYKVCLERYNYIKSIYPNMIENKIALLQSIARLYRIKNKDIKEYLKKEKALKLYKELYSNEILKSDINVLTKIKLLLFRLSPNIHNFIVNLYLRKLR